MYIKLIRLSVRRDADRSNDTDTNADSVTKTEDSLNCRYIYISGQPLASFDLFVVANLTIGAERRHKSEQTKATFKMHFSL